MKLAQVQIIQKIKHTHDIHASQLRPDLHEDSDDGTVEHGRFEEIQICDILVETLKLAHVLDVLQFEVHEWTIGIAFAVYENKNGVAFFPSIFACEPAGRLGEEHHGEEEADGGDHLDAPWDAKCCCVIVVGVLAADK
jgi:hypothetical protein